MATRGLSVTESQATAAEQFQEIVSGAPQRPFGFDFRKTPQPEANQASRSDLPICWAHLIRDFVGFSERKGSAEIGKLLLLETRKMFELWKRVRDGTLARSSFRVYMTPIRRGVEALLRKGTRCRNSKTRGMCKMILKLRPALWTFVRVEGVEPTNNVAERTIRHAVLYRKGCFGTQSEEGSRFVERILTVVATLRQQNRIVMDYLTEACRRALAGKNPPSLLPGRAREAAA